MSDNDKSANLVECRPGCAACCIAPSISSPIPGMPDGKPAGIRCIQLTDDGLCRIFGLPERPEVCVNLKPLEEMCGQDAAHAFCFLNILEKATAPDNEPETKSDQDYSLHSSVIRMN